MGDLSMLVTLKLGENRIGGELPNALGDLASLQELDLSDNQLEGERFRLRSEISPPCCPSTSLKTGWKGIFPIRSAI